MLLLWLSLFVGCHALSSPALTSALLKISYDGKHFSGWTAGNHHPAPNETDPSTSSAGRKRRRRRKTPPGYVRSVQGLLKDNLARVYGNIDPSRIVVEGASRTDAGVHAVGMVVLVYALVEDYTVSTTTGKRLPHPHNATDASQFLPLPMPLEQLAFALNRMSPDDLRVVAYAVPPSRIHPSVDAVAKTYRYRLATSWDHPTHRRLVWKVRGDTNDVALQQACFALLGTHDYRFARGAPRGADDRRKFAAQDTVCTLHRVEWNEEENGITISGDRFLYKMVRFLVGTLVAVRQGKLTVDDVQNMLETGERSPLIECAPAHGLVLEEVHYDCALEWHAAAS